MSKVNHALATLAVVLSAIALAPQAGAADVKMIGKVSSIKVAADGKSAVAVVANTKTGSEVTISVTDKVTLEKFAANGIKVGDEVRLSYDGSGGSNLSKTFKKAEGC